MSTSANAAVQEFIEKIMVEDEAKYQILKAVRKIVFTYYPKMEERMMYGGILFSLAKDVAGVFVYKHHVSLELSNGYRFEDKENLLEGKGKYRRHLKLRSIEEIETKDLAYFVKQLGEN